MPTGLGPNLQRHLKDAGEDSAAYLTAAAGPATGAQMFVPCLVFADGDAFSNVCSSANLIFNGTSISLNRQNRFWRDWMRTQVACEDAARIYKAAGGSYDKYDQRPVVAAKAPDSASVDQVLRPHA